MSATDTIESRIDRILVGAIDPHVHSGPSMAPRAIDHLELAREYEKAGFAAVITKDHDYSGVMTAALIARHNPDLRRKAYTAIAAKMARTIHAVIQSGEPYRPFFEGVSPGGRTSL